MAVESSLIRATRIAGERIQFQAVQAQRQEAITPPSVYAGAGEITPLGADSPIRPRKFQANVGLSIGAPVQFNQGIAAATPRSPGAEESLVGVAIQQANNRNSGFQAGSADPNVDGVLPRYPYDGYIRFDGGEIDAIWISDPSTQVWVEFAAGDGDGGGANIIVGDDEPSNAIGSDGDFYLRDGGAFLGENEVSFWYRNRTYGGSAQSAWVRVERRAKFEAPSGIPEFDDQIWTTKEGVTWAGEFGGGSWVRQPGITYDPTYVPSASYATKGDMAFIDAPASADFDLCLYGFDGNAWGLITCCTDGQGGTLCSLSPPEAPFGPGSPIACNEAHPYPHPQPNSQYGFVCSNEPPD